MYFCHRIDADYQSNSVQPPSPEEIREAREEVGLTQTQAAQRVFMTLRAWQDWEAGKRQVLPIVFLAFKQKPQHLR